MRDRYCMYDWDEIAREWGLADKTALVDKIANRRPTDIYREHQRRTGQCYPCQATFVRLQREHGVMFRGPGQVGGYNRHGKERRSYMMSHAGECRDLTAPEIAERFDCSTQYVYALAIQEESFTYKAMRTDGKSKRQQLIEMDTHKYTAPELAVMLGIHAVTVRKYCWELGIEYKPMSLGRHGSSANIEWKQQHETKS